MPEIPAGFARIPKLSPFNALVGPLYEKREGENVSIGLHIDEKHINSRGICHGGMLATLADIALGYSMLSKTDGKWEYLTAQLSIDYLGPARLGDWVQSMVEFQRQGARLAFANCYLMCGDRRLVRANGIFARADKAG
jgi:acyl-coenzyme A thioesterase 13